MSKSPEAFRTISEVAEWLGVQAHVLRFWESKFSQVKPVKRAGGRRYYRPNDMLLIGGIKKLLHDDGMTIKGVQKLLREQGLAHVQSLSQGLEDIAAPDLPAGGTVLRFQGKSAGAIEAEAIPAEPDPAPDAAESEGDIAAEPEPPLPEPEIAEASEPEPAETPEPEVEEAQEPPRPIRLEIADPPPPEAIEAAPGALARLAAIRSLTSAQAGVLAPLAAELRAWLDRQDTPRAG